MNTLNRKYMGVIEEQLNSNFAFWSPNCGQAVFSQRNTSCNGWLINNDFSL